MVKNHFRLHSKRIAVLFALIMALLLAQSFVMAQTPTSQVEIVGTVSEVTANSITVGTQLFDTTRAEIKAGVEVGKLVKVHATQNAAGEWVVREVELAQPTITLSKTPSADVTETPSPEVTEAPMPTNTFEVTGEITAISDNSIDVAGHTIDISATEIKNSLALGDHVKVYVIVVNDQWITHEVESASIHVTVPANCTLDQPVDWITYIIQARDTLSRIAFGLGSSVQNIATANCIADPRGIQVGQTILVPQQPIIVPRNDDDPGYDVNDDNGGNNSSDDSISDNHHPNDSGNSSSDDNNGHG